MDVPVQFTALLYIPDTERDFSAPSAITGAWISMPGVCSSSTTTRNCCAGIPRLLRGLVDTEDLPLNISRETLQENVILRRINQVVTKQTLGHLEKWPGMKRKKYNSFWRLHGKIFKLGYHDFVNRDRIASLLRFTLRACGSGRSDQPGRLYGPRPPKPRKHSGL